jgi:hypothetical protein
MIFTIGNGREDSLDRDERELVKEVRRVFDGYLLGPVGWADFSFAWDISPGDPKEARNASIRELSLEEWGGEIMILWEWKTYLKEFIDIHGKDVAPPPCFTRQERLGNGSKSNLRYN